MGKFLSTIVFILGIGAFIFGNSMLSKVAGEQEKISTAEENVESHRRPLFGPVRKNAYANANTTAQEKIGAAKQTIATSEVTANWLRGTGVVLFIIGVGGLIVSFSRKKK